MKFTRKIQHGLKNPYKGIKYLFGGREGKKSVLSSYVRNYSEDEERIEKLNDFLKIDLKQYYNEIFDNDILSEIEENIINYWNNFRTVGFGESRILYLLTRCYKPNIIIDTGVYNGLSSAMFLLGLEKNKKGHLYSIDLPYQKRKDISEKVKQIRIANFPKGKSVGWLVPEILRDRWTLQLGDAKILLPQVLKDVKECDIFFHDSVHSYSHMLWEYNTIWPHLNSLLLSDDVHTNEAFDDFVKKCGCQSLKISYRFGLAVTLTN